MNGPWQDLPAVYGSSVRRLSSPDVVAVRTPGDLPHAVYARIQKLQPYHLIERVLQDTHAHEWVVTILLYTPCQATSLLDVGNGVYSKSLLGIEHEVLGTRLSINH